MGYHHFQHSSSEVCLNFANLIWAIIGNKELQKGYNPDYIFIAPSHPDDLVEFLKINNFGEILTDPIPNSRDQEFGIYATMRLGDTGYGFARLD